MHYWHSLSHLLSDQQESQIFTFFFVYITNKWDSYKVVNVTSLVCLGNEQMDTDVAEEQPASYLKTLLNDHSLYPLSKEKRL